MKLYLVKFGNDYPEKITEKCYFCDDKENSWYGGVKNGDYVFTADDATILQLWKVREEEEQINGQSKTILYFDVKDSYDNVRVARNFCMYKYFLPNRDLFNKAVIKEKFIPIEMHDNCPKPEDIDFIEGTTKIFFSLRDDISIDEGDILVKIVDDSGYKIDSFSRVIDSKLVRDEELCKLYQENNGYSLRQLYNSAAGAPRKEKFLEILIHELKKVGFMEINHPIDFYNHILAVRNKSKKS